MVLRGDTISESDVSFASAPTAGRYSVFTVLTMATLFRMSLSMIDISQAFLQSDELSHADKVLTAVPPYIRLPNPDRLKRCAATGMAIVTEQDIIVDDWETFSKRKPEEKRAKFQICLATHRPLYGGRDAPLRWFFKISYTLRVNGWKQMKSDVCTFIKHSKNADGRTLTLTSIIILHVDDLLVAANAEDLKLFRILIRKYRTGELVTVEKDNPITYLGLEICKNDVGEFGVHQTEYISRLQIIKIEDVIKNNAFVISPTRWRTLTRQIVGGLIWANQTRLDGCSVTTILSTNAVETVENPQKALEFLRLYNRFPKSMQERPHIIWYCNFLNSEITDIRRLISEVMILVFVDAGYNNLINSQPTEAMILILGSAMKKEQHVNAKGLLLMFKSKKMTRIARSSLACEASAICQGIDQCVWYQHYLFEILTAQFHRDFHTSMDQLPLLNPYLFGKNLTNLSVDPPVSPNLLTEEDQRNSISLECQCSDVIHYVNQSDMGKNWNEWFQPIDPYKFHIRSVILTDCANAYCAVENISAPSKEK